MLCNSYYKNTKRALFRAALVLALLGAYASPAHATAWRHQLPQAQLVGEGDLRWFGLRIYSAKLWSESETFNTQAPFALELTYHRSISRKQFVDTSIKEIKRLFSDQYSAETLTRWRAEMEAAFTDVSTGDQLIGVSLPNHGCQFYSHSTQLADIRDPEFAKAFFAIWFDPRSKDQGLREKLLGKRS